MEAAVKELACQIQLGTITLFIGPEKSGKTRRLELEGKRQQEEEKQRVLFLASSSDQWMRDRLWPMNPRLIRNVDVILIDDGHLYQDLPKVCQYLAEVFRKHVYVSALNIDENGEVQKPVAELLSLVDRVEYLRSPSIEPTLTLITGPMCSSKTTVLLETYKKLEEEGKNCRLVKYDEDNRFHDDLVAGRDGNPKEIGRGQTLKAHYLGDVTAELLDETVDVVLIDEGQFFIDLDRTCRQLLEKNKRVFITAFNSDINREPFLPRGAKIPPVTSLLALLNDVQLLTAECRDSCQRRPAIFTRLKAGQKDGIGDDAYSPSCRECYCLHKALDALKDKEEKLPEALCESCKEQARRTEGSFTRAMVLMPISNLY